MTKPFGNLVVDIEPELDVAVISCGVVVSASVKVAGTLLIRPY